MTKLQTIIATAELTISLIGYSFAKIFISQLPLTRGALTSVSKSSLREKNMFSRYSLVHSRLSFAPIVCMAHVAAMTAVALQMPMWTNMKGSRRSMGLNVSM